MAPLIDVVFLLLIFFLVATNFTRKEFDQAVQLPATGGGEPARAVPDMFVVNLREDGTLVVNGRVLDENGLREAARSWVAAGDVRRASVRGDRRVPYGAVKRVLAICRHEGITEVDLPGFEEEDG